MEKLTICRICLNKNVRMKVGTAELQEVYHKLTSLSFWTEDLRPQSVCYICFAQLRKAYQLMIDCVRAENLFACILNGDFKVFNAGLKCRPYRLSVEPIQQINISSSDSFLPNDHEEDRASLGDADDVPDSTANIPDSNTQKPVNTLIKDDRNYVIDRRSISASDEKFDDKRQHKCETCQKTFTTSSHLWQHIKLHTGEKPFECDICHKTFTQRSNMKQHIKRHTGEKPFSCDACQKSFTERNQLKKHVRKKHNNGKIDKPYECDICQRTFSERNYLTRHMFRHTGVKRYKCDTCQKMFTERYSLDIHIRLHTGEKPFKCEICRKMFTHRSNLKTHIRTHTGEKPFKCDTCEKYFKHRSHLNDHVRIHTGERPYKCDICHKTFTYRCTLNGHIRTHTGEKPFKCSICHRGFAQLTHLKNHMSRTHTGEKYPVNPMPNIEGYIDHVQPYMMS